MRRRDEHIEVLVANLSRALETASAPGNAFARVAVAGEHLRQGLGAAGTEDEQAAATLRRYEDWLREFAGPHPERPDALLDAVLGRLRSYAAQPGPDRDIGEGERILLDLDAACCVASALSRAGRLAADEVRRLAGRAARVVDDVAPRLPESWDYAERSGYRFAPDPEFPELHDWWESLARLSPGRIAVEAAVRRSAMRERVRRTLRKRYVGSTIVRDDAGDRPPAEGPLPEPRPQPSDRAAVLLAHDSATAPRVGPPLLRRPELPPVEVPVEILAAVAGRRPAPPLGAWLGIHRAGRMASGLAFRARAVRVRSGERGAGTRDVRIDVAPVPVAGGTPRVSVMVTFPRRRKGRQVTAWLGTQPFPLKAVSPERVFEVELPLAEVNRRALALAEGDRLLWSPPKGGSRGPNEKQTSGQGRGAASPGRSRQRGARAGTRRR